MPAEVDGVSRWSLLSAKREFGEEEQLERGLNEVLRRGVGEEPPPDAMDRADRLI
jgi:hypothetical protein